MERAYPHIHRFLDLKDKYDPGDLFDSDWHRALRQTLVRGPALRRACMRLEMLSCLDAACDAATSVGGRVEVLKAMSLIMRIAAHMLLFLIAVLVFFLGLGIGLQVSPLLGTLLWVAAGALAGLNLYLIFKRTR